jgi:hypothetical protein
MKLNYVASNILLWWNFRVLQQPPVPEMCKLKVYYSHPIQHGGVKNIQQW